MRKYSGITNILSPEAISSDKMHPAQMIVNIEIDEYNSGRARVSTHPYRTEFRTIYK